MTFNDLIHLQICERVQICMHPHFFLHYLYLFYTVLYIFHLSYLLYQDAPSHYPGKWHSNPPSNY